MLGSIINEKDYGFHLTNVLDVNRQYVESAKAKSVQELGEVLGGIILNKSDKLDNNQGLSKDNFTQQQAYENLAINVLMRMTQKRAHEVVHSIFEQTARNGEADLTNPLARAFVKAEIVQLCVNKEKGNALALSSLRDHFYGEDKHLTLSDATAKNLGAFLGYPNKLDRSSLAGAEKLEFDKESGKASTKHSPNPFKDVVDINEQVARENKLFTNPNDIERARMLQSGVADAMRARSNAASPASATASAASSASSSRSHSPHSTGSDRSDSGAAPGAGERASPQPLRMPPPLPPASVKPEQAASASASAAPKERKLPPPIPAEYLQKMHGQKVAGGEPESPKSPPPPPPPLNVRAGQSGAGAPESPDSPPPPPPPLPGAKPKSFADSVPARDELKAALERRQRLNGEGADKGKGDSPSR